MRKRNRVTEEGIAREGARASLGSGMSKLASVEGRMTVSTHCLCMHGADRPLYLFGYRRCLFSAFPYPHAPMSTDRATTIDFAR